MFKVKILFIVAVLVAVTASYCPAAEIVHNWRWPSSGSTSFWAGASQVAVPPLTIMTNWQNLDDPNDPNRPDIKRLTETDPNSAFWVETGKGIRMQAESGTAVTNTPTGDWYITAPFSIVGDVPSTLQTMDPNLAPMRLNDYKLGMQIDSGTSGNLAYRTYNFKDLKLQGFIGGWRPAGMRLAGKMTLTGPTAFGVNRDGTTNKWYLDAEVDASRVDEITVLHYSRDSGTPATAQGNHNNSSKMWFAGTWVLESKLYADKAGCLGDADIQLNDGGTPGLLKVSGVATPWVDRRSGNLWVTALDAASKNAKWTIHMDRVVASPLTYGTATYPTAFTPTNPQCAGGRVYVAEAASPVYARELWVEEGDVFSQKSPGTYYATDSANSAWFGTSGTTYNGHIIVTGGTTRNVTMNAVLDPGTLTEPNLTTYPRVGLTKAFLENYALNIKADDPILTPQGVNLKFVNWTTSTGSGIANVNAANTTLTVPTGVDITVTAHYVIAAADPSPVDTAIEVAPETDLGWTPGLASGTQALYFGTNSASLSFVKSFPDGSTSGATNAEIGGPLVDTTVYYWRVDTNGNPGATWQFRTENRRVFLPISPANGAIDVERITPKLTWAAGHATATQWDVYFGTSPSSLAMIDPNGGTTPAPVFTPDVNAPAGLVINTTYYWRVDEYNTYGSPYAEGVVWSFTTRGPRCLSIPRGDLDADCKVTFVDFALVADSFFN